MSALRRAAFAVAALAFAAFASAEERVSFPSLDGAGNAPVVLTGVFFAAPGVPGRIA